MKDHRRAVPVFSLSLATAVAVGLCTSALAQVPLPAPDAARPTLDSGLLDLFIKSIDLFTVLLVLGSVVSVAVIIQCVWEVRARRILPPRVTESITRLAKLGQWTELRHFTSEENSFLSRVVRAAMATPGEDRSAIRDAAELTASEECARWFRKIEPLNVVGNLGPLLGLAGTVWGMIIAFTSLGQGGGQANPGELALGISKALFHTLLGLLLAVPSLLVFGLYRTKIDRHCTRAMVTAAEIVELIPVSLSARGGSAPK